MNYDVFLPYIMIFSVFSIIIILARKIPDISLEAEVKKDWLGGETKKQRRITVLFCKILSILEKILRQIRIHILKLDSKIFNLIQYLRDKSAKKLEEINKFSYKNFVPVAGKKTSKSRIQTKSQNQSVEKSKIQFIPKRQFIKNDDILPADSEPAAPVISLSVPIFDKTSANASKILIKIRFKEEERKLLHIIAKNPKNAENYKKLGMFYCKNKNYLDAEAAFNEYLKLNPSDRRIEEMARNIGKKNQGGKF